MRFEHPAFPAPSLIEEGHQLSQGSGKTCRGNAVVWPEQGLVLTLFKGHFREYSVDRLMAFLTAFDRDTAS